MSRVLQDSAFWLTFSQIRDRINLQIKIFEFLTGRRYDGVLFFLTFFEKRDRIITRTDNPFAKSHHENLSLDFAITL